MKDEQYRLIANSKYGSEWVIYDDNIRNNTYERHSNMFDALCSYHNDSINTIPEYLILDMLRLDMLPKYFRNNLIHGK